MVTKSIMQELIKLAESLDKNGLTKEADLVDLVLKQYASGEQQELNAIQGLRSALNEAEKKLHDQPSDMHCSEIRQQILDLSGTLTGKEHFH